MVALPWILSGLALRAWSFAYLGPGGRTRSAAPPVQRVAAGPYRLLEHPVYVANIAVAFGLVLAAAPPALLVLLLSVGVVGFYAILAVRESTQLVGLPLAEPVQRLGWLQLLRSERSTLACVGLFLGLSFL